MNNVSINQELESEQIMETNPSSNLLDENQTMSLFSNVSDSTDVMISGFSQDLLTINQNELMEIGHGGNGSKCVEEGYSFLQIPKDLAFEKICLPIACM